MPHKRRRPAPRRDVNVLAGATVSGLLSDALQAELGQSDACNCLIAPPRRKKRNATHNAVLPSRDRKREQVEKKKEREVVLQDVYQQLQKHALSSEQFAELQERSRRAKQKKNPRSEDSLSDDASSSEDRPLEPPKCPSPELVPESPIEATEVPRSPSVDSVSPVRAPVAVRDQPHRVVHVERSVAIEASRHELPILGYEQEIMELLSRHDIVIICGQTGCGKTTQVPQFLYEAGYGTAAFSERSGAIGVTQPRRIATTSTAARVATELSTSMGQLVGYQIRHENKTASSTVIKFMTDGILIREIQRDFLLSAYSALIIDEAHERSLNTDLILGMLSRVVKLRRKLTTGKPLKVVIMSATLEAGAFLSNKKLFPVAPPVMNIPSRQFSVTIHFSKYTEVDDYEKAAFKKVCRMHRQLPPGGILVFLTGKREIDKFCSQLQKHLQERRPLTDSTSDLEDCTSEEEIEVLPGNTEAEEVAEEKLCSGVVVLPLYAMLPPRQQSLVFQPVPEGHRLIVVATNVAETSITIPGIRFVVDSGRAKKKLLHSETGVSHFSVDWISKASATQRAGRAGRTLPGHCYRLYSSAHYGQRFRDYELPEISCVALEEVVLLMKSMEIHRVTQFPFPTAPELSSLKSAEESLFAMGALNEARKVTQVGKQLMEFPIGPRHARMIIHAKQLEEQEAIEGLSLYAVSLAAVMSLDSPFLIETEATDKAARKQARRLLTCLSSDPISSLTALCCYQQAADPVAFCQKVFLHGKIMKEMAALEHQLRQIFLKVFDLECPEALRAVLPEPSEEMCWHLRRCIVAGWCDQIARQHGDIPLIQKRKQVPYATQSLSDQAVFLHPLSAVAKSAPQFVVYMNAMQTSERVYLHQVTKVEPEWIYEAAKPLCTVHERVLSPGPYYDAKKDAICCWHKVTFGSHSWELPLQSIPCQEGDICVPHFALALLSGHILPLEALKGGHHLVMSSRYILSVEAKFNKRLGRLLSALHEQRIYSKSALLSHHILHPCFLKEELKLWIKPQEWSQFESQWKSLHQP